MLIVDQRCYTIRVRCTRVVSCQARLAAHLRTKPPELKTPENLQ
jgi:hypothetical protein